MFRGSALAKIDDKGRLKIPTDFRRTLEYRYGPEVFVTSVQGEGTRRYPLKVWDSIEERLGAMPSTHGVRRRYMERVSCYGSQTRLDGQGRAPGTGAVSLTYPRCLSWSLQATCHGWTRGNRQTCRKTARADHFTSTIAWWEMNMRPRPTR